MATDVDGALERLALLAPPEFQGAYSKPRAVGFVSGLHTSVPLKYSPVPEHPMAMRKRKGARAG